MSWLLCLMILVSAGHRMTVDAGCSWIEYPNSNTVGGAYKNVTSLDECKCACLTKRCNSINWNSTTKGCWLLKTQDGRRSLSGVTQYDYVCTDYCPDGFIYLPLAKSCYQVVYEKHTWASADTRCRQLQCGANLVAITSKDETDALKSHLRLQFETNPASTVCISGGRRALWSSGQRLDENSCKDPYVWKLSRDEQLAFDFTYWYSSQPDCYQNSQQCIVLYSTLNYAWVDTSCSDEICALCEYPSA